MKLYFVRHGESEANLLHEFSNRGHKHGLTTHGKAQATTLAHRLRGAGVTHLFSSPLLRALETTAILAHQSPWPSSRHGGKGRLDFLYSTSRAIRRDEQARHNSRVASIQYASGRWLWCNRVWVRSLKVLLQL
jgi:bisphosphoglycerate-dependent phosphoglycerate mutase